MKKTIVFTLIMLFACSSQAQFSLGLSTGLTIAQSTYDIGSSDITKKTVSGVPFNFIAEIGKNVRFHTGFSLLTKGLSFRDTYTAGDYAEETYKFKYVEIPLNVKVYFNKQPLRFYAIGGPYIGIISSGKFNYEEKDGTYVEKTSERFKPKDEGFETLDAGMRIGGGIEFAKSFGSIFFNPCYSIGLTNMSEDKTEVLRNNLLSFNIGYLYTFKKKVPKTDAKK